MQEEAIAFVGYDADNLARKLVNNGLKTQDKGEGLLHFVDVVFENRTQTHEAIRSEIVHIMKLATDCHKKSLVYQPMTQKMQV